MAFLGGGGFLHGDAGNTAQFKLRMQSLHGHFFADPVAVRVPELARGADAVGCEHFCVAPAHPPDILHGDLLEQRIAQGNPRLPGISAGFGLGNPEHALVPGLLFGDAVGQLGQGFGGGHAYGDGNARPLADGPADIAAVLSQALSGLAQRTAFHAVQSEKGLVDGVDFDLRCEAAERTHDTGGHVAVERVIGRINVYAVAFVEIFALESGLAHGNAHGLGFVGTCDDTAVIVGKHYYGFSAQLRRKDAFAGNIEIVAIGQGKNRHASSIRAAGTGPDVRSVSKSRIDRKKGYGRYRAERRFRNVRPAARR